MVMAVHISKHVQSPGKRLSLPWPSYLRYSLAEKQYHSTSKTSLWPVREFANAMRPMPWLRQYRCPNVIPTQVWPFESLSLSIVPSHLGNSGLSACNIYPSSKPRGIGRNTAAHLVGGPTKHSSHLKQLVFRLGRNDLKLGRSPKCS